MPKVQDFFLFPANPFFGDDIEMWFINYCLIHMFPHHHTCNEAYQDDALTNKLSKLMFLQFDVISKLDSI